MSYSNCDFIVKVLVSLSAYIDQSHFDGQRGTVTVFYVEVMKKLKKRTDIVINIITMGLLFDRQ